MKNIPAPFGNFIDEFKELVKRKNNGVEKNTLEAIYATIEARYTDYCNKKLQLETVSIIPRNNGEIAALASCYSNSSKFKEELIDDEKQYTHEKTPRCPYCQIGRANTWDHFLPSAKYPDFYVLRPNLIHVCHICNETKGDRYITPTRKTINPYFDDLSGATYLKCNILGGKELTATYAVEPDTASNGYDPHIAEIAMYHFEIYGLAGKLRAEASSKISNLKTEVQAWKMFTKNLPTQANLVNYLDLKLRDLKSSGEGPNNWEVALWTNLKHFPDLLCTVHQWYEENN